MELLRLEKYLSGNLNDSQDSPRPEIRPLAATRVSLNEELEESSECSSSRKSPVRSEKDDRKVESEAESPIVFKDVDFSSKLSQLEEQIKTKGKRGGRRGRGAAVPSPSAVALGPRRTRSMSKRDSVEATSVPPAANPAPAPVPAKRGRRGARGRQRGARGGPSVEVIDLISSPPLILPGVVNLDSDDEDNQRGVHSKPLDMNLDDLNSEITVKVIWKGELERHKMRKHDPFETLMKVFADREGQDLSKVVFVLNDSIVSSSDTPDSIHYSIVHVISGRIVENMGKSKKAVKDKNVIKIRVNAEGLKKPLEININKTQTFAPVMVKCAELLGKDVTKLKIMFDGDVVGHEETPVDLDFEGGEIIDCVMVK